MSVHVDIVGGDRAKAEVSPADALRAGPSPRFHELVVADVRAETAEAVSIAFAVPDALRADYRFAAGQYLTLRALIDGGEVRRSYSICSAPGGNELRVAVKRVADGIMSGWVHGGLRVGDRVPVMTPTGRFGLGPTADGRVHAAFVAGSGITPVLSVLRHVLATEPSSRFFLFYGNRATADVMFRRELDDLKDRHLGRLSLFHVLSCEEQDIAVLNGRIDGDKTRLLLRTVLPAAAIDQAYVCGPDTMITQVVAALHDLGVQDDAVHVERFVSADGGRPRVRAPAPPDGPAHALAEVVIDGKRRTIPVAADETILDAAIRAGMDLPFACKGGMCSTCRARLVEGEAAMDANYALEPWELAAGFVLTCQARPTTAQVTVDFDHV